MDILLPYLHTVILAAIVLFSCYLLKRSKSSKTKLAPQAGGAWPIIGHLPLLAGAELPHIRLGALANKYGPIFTIRIGMYPALVVSSWELAKELFTTNDAIVSSRPKLTGAKILGYNFANFGFSPYGEFWRGMRKITASELLSNRRLEQLKHVRTSEVEVSVKDLYKLWYSKDKNEATQVMVELKQWVGDINLNVILRMIAGKRYYGAGVVTDENEARRCQRAMREFFHLTGLFVLRDAAPFLGWLDWGGHEKAMKKNAEELDSIVDQWLEEHRRKKDSAGESANKEEDFMDVLLYALDGINLAGYDADTVRKATSLSLIGQHFELLPFGAGRRACPGMNFGLQMSHLVLASFLQAFEVSPLSNATIDMTATAGLTSSKATPLEVLIKPRLPASVYE
ncbi:unnamed protein product [Dovyalis caffra]|uniref:Cytochrome P450 n=1 Tax=Dovyalis caffra TaxID=77055 RepID=A0AAV1RTR5_9ROSI|nr:unnamed protein product [Dovyalis caffra]